MPRRVRRPKRTSKSLQATHKKQISTLAGKCCKAPLQCPTISCVCVGANLQFSYNFSIDLFLRKIRILYFVTKVRSKLMNRMRV